MEFAGWWPGLEIGKDNMRRKGEDIYVEFRLSFQIFPSIY